MDNLVAVSDYDKVKQFTEQSTGAKSPTTPQPMNKKEMTFIIEMVVSELIELAQTRCDSSADACKLVQKCMDNMAQKDISKQPIIDDKYDLINEQADAAVDIWYYLLNAYSKKGINISKHFDIVHNANMDKRDLKTGKFIIRESDGKVLKREGWKPPQTKQLYMKM
jgi:predicted HAD superfamily Cof-like phosphohydrolase